MWSGVGWQVDIGQLASLPMPLFPSGNIEPRTLFLALRSEWPATQRAQVLNCFVLSGTLRTLIVTHMELLAFEALK